MRATVVWRFCITVAAALAVFSSPGASLLIKPTMNTLMVEVGDEELCLFSTGKDFFEGVSLHYQVIQGDEDFDVIIRDPYQRAVYASYAGEHEAEDRVYFTTRSPKQYEYCFDNRNYSASKKLIKVDIGLTTLKRWKRRIDPLDKVMKRSEGVFLGMHEDQILLRLREQMVKEKLEDVLRLLTQREAVETVIIIAVAALNVALVTRLLRRVS